MLTFLNKTFSEIGRSWAKAWHYGSEVSRRRTLSESKFRAAGKEAGRRGFEEVQFVPFLLQAKNAVERMVFFWNSRKLSTVRSCEASQPLTADKRSQGTKVTISKRFRGSVNSRLGFVPRFNPFRKELFLGALLGGGVIEFFLNSSALETAGQSENLTRILAAILSLAFVLGIDLLGKHRAQGKPILLLTLLLAGLIAGITLIREDAVVGYMTHIQESVPELGAGVANPRVFVLLFLGVQLLFFYFAYHLSVPYHDFLLSEYHDAKMAERGRRSGNVALESIDRRLDSIAVVCLNEWGEYQRFFDHRVLIFIEAAEVHRDEGHMVFSRLDLAEPPVVTWSRRRLGDKQSPAGVQLPPKERKDHVAAPLIALAICLVLVGRASAEVPADHASRGACRSQPIDETAHRAQQLATVRKTLESWKPTQAIDILGVNENPIGRRAIGHIDPFPYDSTISNPARYRIDSTILRKKYLGTILPAVERAIADEDEKNKRRPTNLAETCLVDGLEAAARAFQRVASQSREILLLTDGFEDCRDSIHLPRERLTPSRIATIIDQFERQSQKLPRFIAPVTAHIVGMLLNDAYPRSYEDSVGNILDSALKKMWNPKSAPKILRQLCSARGRPTARWTICVFSSLGRRCKTRWTPSKPNRQGPLS